MKTLLLVCDLEEFSLPCDLKMSIPEPLMLAKSYEGMEIFLNFIQKNEIKVTFFVTEKIFKAYPDLIKKIVSQGHEIGYHAMVSRIENKHSDRMVAEIRHGKENMEKTLGIKINGFRNHKLYLLPSSALKEAGFSYDNTCHPTYVPGRYFNFFRSRHMSKINNIINLPISVTPILRLPFSWIWFRNFGLGYAKLCTFWALLTQDSINIYFHSWEFSNIIDGLDFKLPYAVTHNTGEKMILLLDNYLKWCAKNRIRSETIYNYLTQNKL